MRKTQSGRGGLIGLAKRLRRRLSGSVAVEMALFSPILAYMAVGIGEFGIGVYLKMQVEHAAQAGVQYALVHGYSSTAVTNAVTSATTTSATQSGVVSSSAIFSGISLPATQTTFTGANQSNPTQNCGCASGTTITAASCTISAAGSCSCTCAGGNSAAVYVTVTAKGTYTTFLNYPGVSGPFVFTATASARLQ